jgi:tRNA(Ser,Leu) C12 N-acetylase TAN1
MLTIEDKFNILLSCSRFREVESCQELHRLVDEDQKLCELNWCKMTGISSLVVAQVACDCHDFVQRLSQVVKKMPWSVRELLKIQPIDLVVESSLEAIRAGTQQLAQRMPKDAKFRVNLHRRDTKLDRKTLLHEVATQFPGEVDLEDYEWICAVEVLGPVTGLALIKEEEILTMRRP